jgi:hypothetical protein
MAVTLPTTTPAAPAPAIPSSPLPRAARRELARADVHAELMKLLMHGYGSMLVKIHDHRISLVETTARLLEGKSEE